MADDSRPDAAPKAGATLDLSTGKPPSRRKRKGPPPVVQQTINLSTPKPETPKDERPADTPKAAKRPKRGKGSSSNGPRSKRGEAPTAASSSLADLLDPDVLAKLRGG